MHFVERENYYMDRTTRPTHHISQHRGEAEGEGAESRGEAGRGQDMGFAGSSDGAFDRNGNQEMVHNGPCRAPVVSLSPESGKTSIPHGDSRAQ